MQIFFDISFTSNLPYALGTVGVALGAALGGGGGGTPGSANEVCRLNFNLREWNRSHDKLMFGYVLPSIPNDLNYKHVHIRGNQSESACHIGLRTRLFQCL